MNTTVMKNLFIQTVILFLLTIIASCNNPQAKTREGEIVGQWSKDVASDNGYSIQIINGQYIWCWYEISKNKAWELGKLNKEIRNGQVVFLDNEDTPDSYYLLESNGDLSMYENGEFVARLKSTEGRLDPLPVDTNR